MTDAPFRPPPHRIEAGQAHALYGVAQTRRIEIAALQSLRDAGVLMARAGHSTARLARALVPHARRVWVAAGPGNNGGDGLEAGAHLRTWGLHVTATWLGNPESASRDTCAALAKARAAGVTFSDTPPDDAELTIDALLGIGASRAIEGRMAEWITRMNDTRRPVLAVDVPSGLDADTGRADGVVVRATATLTMLTLKPGLFTGRGRDAAGTVWLDDLQAQAPADAACAWLPAQPSRAPRPHASHKGNHGDVAVVGGAPGMGGAALLAARAALAYGAGRVFVGALDPALAGAVGAMPEVMVRPADRLPLDRLTVVCGCGGGDAVRAVLPAVLSAARTLVLDADGLNAVAADAQLRRQLRARSERGLATVLTPHPLEAARLLETTTAAVQSDRLDHARRLADDMRCVVVLKGSGSVVAAPGRLPVLNTTGNARLAVAGTGDVLAGAIGAALAAGLDAHRAAEETVYSHGLVADRWPTGTTLTASALAGALQPPWT